MSTYKEESNKISSDDIIENVKNISIEDDDIYFNGKVSEESALDFVKILRDQEKKKIKLVDKKQKIFLNTCGGSVIQGLRIYDAIKSSPLDIIIIVDGYAASMGTIIICAAKEAHITKNSYIMLHEISGWDYGRYHQLKVSDKFREDLMKRLTKIYAEKTKHKKITNTWLEKDRWLDSNAAKKLKIVDKII